MFCFQERFICSFLDTKANSNLTGNTNTLFLYPTVSVWLHTEDENGSFSVLQCVCLRSLLSTLGNNWYFQWFPTSTYALASSEFPHWWLDKAFSQNVPTFQSNWKLRVSIFLPINLTTVNKCFTRITTTEIFSSTVIKWAKQKADNNHIVLNSTNSSSCLPVATTCSLSLMSMCW